MRLPFKVASYPGKWVIYGWKKDGIMSDLSAYLSVLRVSKPRAWFEAVYWSVRQAISDAWAKACGPW